MASLRVCLSGWLAFSAAASFFSSQLMDQLSMVRSSCVGRPVQGSVEPFTAPRQVKKLKRLIIQAHKTHMDVDHVDCGGEHEMFAVTIDLIWRVVWVEVY